MDEVRNATLVSDLNSCLTAIEIDEDLHLRINNVFVIMDLSFINDNLNQFTGIYKVKLWKCDDVTDINICFRLPTTLLIVHQVCTSKSFL